MLLEKIDLQNEYIRKSLLLKDNFESSWVTYKKQYMAALNLLFGVAKEKKYQMNSISMPFLFIFRHTIELLLKEECVKKNVEIQNVHDLSRIATKLGDKTFLQMQEQTVVLDWDTQGDEFRYNTWTDWAKTGCGEKLDVYFASSYFSLEQKMVNAIELGDKKLHEEMTFHLRELSYLGQVRTQYDLCATKLLNRVLGGKSQIDAVFLPVMFCFRHSMELALKSSLMELYKINKTTTECVKQTHSLEKLFSELDKYLGIAINKIPKHDPLYKETVEKRKLWNALRAKIQQLDSKSLAFRFPCNKLVLIDITLIVQTLELYQKVDAYLTFCVDVLKSSGYIVDFENDLN